jgi:hypothetical protein
LAGFATRGSFGAMARHILPIRDTPGQSVTVVQSDLTAGRLIISGGGADR